MRTIHTIIFLLLIIVGNAQHRRTIPPEKPKLIISIVIEEMRYDFIDRFWNKFEEGGFKRLVGEGTYFKNAQLNYMFTQSSPGYASIYTGATPSVHGIVADQWYKALSNTIVKSTAYKRAKTIGSNSGYGKYAPKHLVTTTFSDEYKLIDPKSKIISLALDPTAAVLSGGHMSNAAYWIDDKTGKWISSSYYLDSLPQWVNIFNNKNYQNTYLDKIWSTLYPLSHYTESRNDTTNYEYGYGNNNFTFPYDISTFSRIKKDYPDYTYFNKTPFGNNYTESFAIASIVGEDLGKDAHTDFLNIAFTATKEIANRFGPLSVEMEDTYLRLDKELAHFLDFLDTEIGKHNILIVLSANHGVSYATQYLTNRKIPSGNFKSQYAIALLKSYLNATYGKGDWVKMYYNQQIYLNKSLIEDSKLNITEVQQKVADFMVQFEGVANAISSSILMKSEFRNGMYAKMQNSYNQKRSGDIMLNLNPAWIQDVSLTASSNSPYVYDTHIPLIWYGWRIKHQEKTEDVNITDIAPTIAFLLNISKPNGSIGNPLKGLIK